MLGIKQTRRFFVLPLVSLLTLPIHAQTAPTAPPANLDTATARTTCEQEFVAGHYVQALPACQALLHHAEQKLGPDDESVGYWVGGVGQVLHKLGRYKEAEPLYRRSLGIREKVKGKQHPDVAESLNNLGILLEAQGKLTEAEPLYKRSLGVRETALGKEHPDVAQSLNNLGTLLQDQGNLAAAEPLFIRSLGIYEKALGKEHPDVAKSLNNLGSLLRAQGKLAEAEPLFIRSLSIMEKALGKEHPDVATSLGNLGTVLKLQGKLAEAEPLFIRSLSIMEKALGKERPLIATSLNNLGMLLQAQGKLAEAEPMLKRSLDIREKALGKEHPLVALSLNNLSMLLQDQGKLTEAEPLLKRSLDIQEKALGEDHSDVATALNNLGTLRQAQGRLAEAEPLLKRSLDIREKTLGKEHSDVATSLNNLGTLRQAQGKLAEAAPLFKRSLSIMEKALGKEHPDVATSLVNIGVLDVLQANQIGAQAVGRPGQRLHSNKLAAARYAERKVQEATELLMRSLHIRERALGPEHSGVADSLMWLSRLYSVVGANATALSFLERATEVREVEVRATVSEPRMRALLARRRTEEEQLYNLLFAGNMPEPLRANVLDLALRVSLLRKGRVAEAGAQANRWVQRGKQRPELAQKLAQWEAVRRRREGLLFGAVRAESVAGYRAELDRLKWEAEQLEAELALAIPELKTLQPPSLKQIAKAVGQRLKPDEALVEFVWTRPSSEVRTVGAAAERTPRFLALVLRGDGGQEVVDLGSAAIIDPAVHWLSRELASPSSQPQEAAQAVYQRIMVPLLPALKMVRKVYLALDGSLNAVPFDALHDGHSYLTDEWQFTYLTSGRDLLLEPSKRRASGPLLLGNPDFGEAVQKAPLPGGRAQPTDAVAGKTLYQQFEGLKPLKGAQAEVEKIAAQWQVTAWTGRKASEPRLREAHGPLVLHVATHGLLLAPGELRTPKAGMPDAQVALPLLAMRIGSASAPLGEVMSGWDARWDSRSQRVLMAQADALLQEEEIMSRSALALANVRQSIGKDTAEDGLLTAEEARGLDLEGTQLTVLSACDTALGSVQAGDGVSGLVRGFMVAGSETVVASLWRVNDPATKSLMERFYDRLQKGEPRLTALRAAMHEVKQEQPHPYYWAPFVGVGRDAPLARVRQ